MTDNKQTSVTQADRNIASDYFYQTKDYPRAKAARDGTYDLSICVQMFTRHREQSTADLRAELADLKTALAEADSKNGALSHEWNKCEAEIARLRAENRRFRGLMFKAAKALQARRSQQDDKLDWIVPQFHAALSTQPKTEENQ